MQLTDFFLDVVHELLFLILVIFLLCLGVFSLLWNQNVIVVKLINLFLKHVVCLLMDFHLILDQVLL